MSQLIEIPGRRQYTYRPEYRYVAVSDHDAFEGKDGLLDRLCLLHQPLIPQSGKLEPEHFIILLPDGRRFYCFSYSGDREGWREQVIKSSRLMQVKLAEIQEDVIRVDDDAVYNLKECSFARYHFYANNELVTAITAIGHDTIAWDETE